ncbi:MAG: MotA/TolQ/ExbB proton channel family protein, partial [Thioalkalispiraceae bacterium]
KFADQYVLEVALTRHLTIIASIASNAPYIGLLGTVLGILVAFYDLSQAVELSAATVMLGLALALKATAAGLAVAIPATLLYNALLRRTEVLKARWQSMREAG